MIYHNSVHIILLNQLGQAGPQTPGYAQVFFICLHSRTQTKGTKVPWCVFFSWW